MSRDLTITTVGHVAVAEIRRPPANYFDHGLIADLVVSAKDLQARGTRAIILCSEGKHFCAGANFSEGGMEADRARSSELLYREAVRLFDVKVPIIAAVQGSAVGGGLGLACAADFRVATPSSRFHANFSILGFHQGFGLSETLPAIVGAQRAMDLLYTSRRINGQCAFDIGLVDRLVPDGELRAEALHWAAEIASAAPLAVQSIRETLRAPLARRVHAVLKRELDQQQQLWATKDSKIGIAANLARDTAVFTGE
ncbi:enoyl-CoA hydratase/isomerase family protein [Mycobacterium sp. CVI_P3]|uniref:Enoyl-CoA hydratase/isomerase family protein n=1 Tax=Mycobacterium pinniadriaticum TaxID=2994102 RepID=A0ABT3SKQ5_9MYCO|nr:enoyl-CoA hydratase/isomerase family protein [Mycobacterium pinniadriaticum]MCX2933688.1 enoyl-CoA hydratase/isomerase family protein [Mycobacterium pinniadriaticum]MCX2940110.1 enoyl-CoA hydratase/isomerase family protein [Mycobacterium pinniadriaticum]